MFLFFAHFSLQFFPFHLFTHSLIHFPFPFSSLLFHRHFQWQQIRANWMKMSKKNMGVAAATAEMMPNKVEY